MTNLKKDQYSNIPAQSTLQKNDPSKDIQPTDPLNTV